MASGSHHSQRCDEATAEPPRPRYAFTVDVEDYFQVSAFEGVVSRDDWDKWPSRVVDNTRRLLELLASRGVSATFFVLGWVAERHPHLVREIDGAGHEIGTHGYWHRLVYDQTPQEFREDLRRSIDVLEGITGKHVAAYRAPSFSITRRSQWALDVMAEEGIECDSSVFPMRHDRYGIPDAATNFHQRQTRGGAIWECPPSVALLGPWRVPAAGGGYFRLLPPWLFHRLIERIERRGNPYVFYIHPWEIDPGQPRVPGISATARFRHYNHLDRTAGRLRELLDRFPFSTLGDVLNSCRGAAVDAVPTVLA